ncbi:carboxymethylenebutenolidase homolog isoform X2 [Lepidochelys kempii]
MANEARPCPCDIGDRFEYGGLGHEVQVEHIKAYVCKPSASTEKAVVVIQDIFGWQLPNTRYMVDMLAANGYIAICPDFFVGKEPWNPSDDWSTFGEWLKTRDARKIDQEADVVLRYLKQQCSAKKIGVVGFCWGGIVVHHLMMKYPELKAGVSVYGIIGDSDDRYNLLKPTFFIFGEKDDVIPLDQMANEARPCPCDIGDRFEYGGLGHEVQVEHIKAYVCKPSASTGKAVVVIHDIFGWQLPNTRYITDMLAANGYIAICPDFFVGQKPWDPSDDWSIFNDWLKTRDASKVDREVDVILKYLKEQCNAKKIGVIGFCWGGMAVHHLMLKNPELKTGVAIYGVIKYFEDRYSLLHPTFFIFGESDDYIPLEQVTLLEQKLKQHCKVDYRVKIYPGQTHGFVHRRREDINPQDKPYIEEARKDMIYWLNKYL